MLQVHVQQQQEAVELLQRHRRPMVRAATVLAAGVETGIETGRGREIVSVTGIGEMTATAVIATDGMIETETETDGRAAAVAGVVTEVVVLLHVDDQDPGPLVAAAVGKGGDGDAFDN